MSDESSSSGSLAKIERYHLITDKIIIQSVFTCRALKEPDFHSIWTSTCQSSLALCPGVQQKQALHPYSIQ